MRDWPVQVRLAERAELETIGAWMADPGIYADGFALPVQPDPAWVRRSLLIVQNGEVQEMQPVRFWSVQDSTGTRVGFAVDFGWDGPEDPVREIDIAFPERRGQRPWLYLYTVAALAGTLFLEHGAREVRGCVRLGGEGRGFPHLFASVGAEVARVEDPRWHKGPRIYYRATRDSFVASRFGGRFAALHAGRGAAGGRPPT
jgi:hypothetical protein